MRRSKHLYISTSPGANKLLLAIAFIVGIVFLAGFNTAMDATNDMDFCISCHEMKNTVYQEYKESAHYNNAKII